MKAADQQVVNAVRIGYEMAAESRENSRVQMLATVERTMARMLGKPTPTK
jgi:hypothetical protein